MKNASVMSLVKAEYLLSDRFRCRSSIKSVELDCGYRMDIVVDNRLVLELKTVEKILPIHEAQLLTYLKLGRLRTGLLLNFNTSVLKDGIRRLVL